MSMVPEWLRKVSRYLFLRGLEAEKIVPPTANRGPTLNAPPASYEGPEEEMYGPHNRWAKGDRL